jgi:hypothetical protein
MNRLPLDVPVLPLCEFVLNFCFATLLSILTIPKGDKTLYTQLDTAAQPVIDTRQSQGDRELNPTCHFAFFKCYFHVLKKG